MVKVLPFSGFLVTLIVLSCLSTIVFAIVSPSRALQTVDYVTFQHDKFFQKYMAVLLKKFPHQNHFTLFHFTRFRIVNISFPHAANNNNPSIATIITISFKLFILFSPFLFDMFKHKKKSYMDKNKRVPLMKS